MDGTLSDSEALHFQAYRIVFARMLPDHPANPISRDFYNANMAGKTKFISLSALLPEGGNSAEDIEKVATALEDEFSRLAKTDLKPLPGLLGLLDFLSEQGVRCGIVTNAPPTELEFGVDCLGLEGRFEALVPSSECSDAKPHPAPYLEGLRRLDLKSSEAFAVEDSLAGVRSAVDAGLVTIGVTTSRSEQELLDQGAAMTVADFSDAELWSSIRAALDKRS